jgi:hypothetical protein
MKQVITSTDLNKDYSFFIPIIYFAWKNLGYDLNLFINCSVSNLMAKNNEILFKVLNELKIKSIFLHNKDYNIPQEYSWSLSPFSRLFGCYFDLPDNDYLLTTDIDMIPLDSKWFNSIDENKINIYGEDGSTGGYGHSRYPICYIGMTVGKWKNLIGYDVKKTLNETINYKLSNIPKTLTEGQWRSLDETYFHYLFRDLASDEMRKSAIFYFRYMIPNPAFKGHDNKTPFILPAGRIDRSNWDLSMLPTAIDAHCPRPGYNDENWSKILPILEKCLTDDQLKYTKNYREEFIKWTSV